jgi:hypothetical protein
MSATSTFIEQRGVIFYDDELLTDGVAGAIKEARADRLLACLTDRCG